MMMNEQSKREKLEAKILFWSLVVPTIFGVFFRIFFIFFNFVYGLLIVKIIGQDYAGLVAGIALITSLGFTIGVLIWVHEQYKKHILATF
jgi:hypothetical protein